MGAVRVERRESESTVVIHVVGPLCLDHCREFRDAYRHSVCVLRFVVNLSCCEHIDSAGLGIIMLLWEYAGAEGAEVEITDAPARVERSLRIAGFGTLLNTT